MVKRPKREPTSYQVFLEPRVHAERRDLPGDVRQRIKRAIDSLATDPRPPHSRVLDLGRLEDQVDIPDTMQVCRLRLEHWRIIYAIDEVWQAVIVLAIRRRPPYDYQDLRDLLAGLS